MDNTLLRLLIVNDSSNDAESLLNALRKEGYATRPKLVDYVEDFAEALNEQPWDLILANLKVQRLGALDILHTVAQYEHDIPVIVLAEEAEESVQVEVMRAGAKDMVPRHQARRLLQVIQRELLNLGNRRKLRLCESNVREVQRRSKALLETSQDAVAYMLDGMHINVNPVYARLFGFEDVEDLTGLPMMDLIATPDHARFKTFIRDLRRSPNTTEHCLNLTGLGPKGEVQISMEFAAAKFDGEDCYQVIARDISGAAAMEKLSLVAQQDKLTGLYNHHYFLNALQEMVSTALQQEKRTYLVYIEIDNFQTIQEAVGVVASDEVIRGLAALLRGMVTPEITLARFGDITYTALLPKNDAEAALHLAQGFVDAIDHHILEVAGRSVATTCSVGVVHITESTQNPEQVLTRAGNACRQAREAGGNQVHLYDPVADADEDSHWDFEHLKVSVRDAVKSQRLTLQFQPIVKLHGETEEFYEALLQAEDQRGNPIDTHTVFRIAEELKLLSQLDTWVVETVLDRLAKRKLAGYETRFFVKLSDQAFMDETISLLVSKQLKAAGLHCRCLIFELSETSAMTHVKQAKAFVNALRQLGCGTAIEHFGSGLNSFNVLNHVDADFLKFDASFVVGLYKNPNNQAAIRKMTDQAKQLGKRTVAPNVEDANSLAVLWQCNVDYAQGDYIQEPSAEMSYDFSETG